MILITGTTGLVGSHLAMQLLEKETVVRSIYRDISKIELTKQVFELNNKSHLFDKIEWIEGDILDIPSLEIAFEGIQKVYHCAALISFDPKDEENLRKTNIEGTSNIVNFCIDKNIKKICFVSSIAALGDLPKNQTDNYINESMEWNPETEHSDYAITKHGAEMEVWRAQEEGLQIVIVNPGVVLGPNLWKTGSGEVFSKVKNGLPFYTNGITGLVSVFDLVSIMVQLMESKISGEKFIVVAENYSYKNLLFEIADAYQVRKPKFYASKTMTAIGYKLDWIISTVFQTKRKLSKDIAKSLHSKDFYDNSKIKKALNFEFESLSKTIEKFAK